MQGTMSKTIRIAVLAEEDSPTLRDHIVPAASRRGHTLDVINLPTVDLRMLFSDPRVTQLLSYDVVYYRTGLGPFGSFLLGEYLREHGVPTVNFTSAQHPYLAQKVYQVARVAPLGIRTPRTLMDVSDSYPTIVQYLGSPFIMKADVSSQGRDVHLIGTEEAWQELVVYRKEKAYFYQEYVAHEHDCRVHVIGGMAVFPYRRIPTGDDFRANVSRGGSMETLTGEEAVEVSALAERVAAHFAWDVCAVDFLPHQKTGELYFTEINMNPGWQGVRAVLGGDPSEAVIDLLEARVLRADTK